MCQQVDLKEKIRTSSLSYLAFCRGGGQTCPAKPSIFLFQTDCILYFLQEVCLRSLCLKALFFFHRVDPFGNGSGNNDQISQIT